MTSAPPIIMDQTHRRADVLVEPEWVEEHLDDPQLRLIEVDVSATAYDQGHIPGAALWNVYRDLKDSDYRLLAPVAMEDLLARTGIEPGSTVVCYGYAPALAFWLMKLYRHADVCVLDLMLPGRDGWSIIESARAEGIPTPIVVVSARGTEHDRVHALEIGADDYLVKPFSMNELVARVRAASRRALRRDDAQRGDPIQIEELLIDPGEVQAFVDGESAGLTPTEFRLLYQLALERGRVVTRDELLQKIWGRRLTRRDRTVDVFVRKLREKIDKRAPRHSFVHTRYGVGYKLEAQPKGEATLEARSG